MSPRAPSPCGAAPDTVRRMATRRQFLAGLGAGALVVGFDPATRLWVNPADASELPSFDRVPPLDGTLHLDLATRQADARDLGRMVEHLPYAVLRPGSVQDIQKMV